MPRARDFVDLVEARPRGHREGCEIGDWPRPNSDFKVGRVLDRQRLQRHVIAERVQIDVGEHPSNHALKLSHGVQRATDQCPLASD